MRRKTIAILRGLTLSTFACVFATAARGAGDEAAIKTAPANTWVKLVQSPNGWREQPIFVYAPNIKRFVMASGIQATGGTPPRHYDTEEFDPAAGKWFNAYPEAVADGRPESGPVGEEYSKKVEKLGWNGPEPFYKDGESLRLNAGGQWAGFRTCYEWCYVPDDAKVYAYLGNMTLRYDPAKRTWEDLKAKPRTSNRLWGSMVYDPVNKEIVHAGGDGGTVDVGTWVYSVEKNEWRKLPADPAKDAQRKLHRQAVELCWQAKALLGAACNRFTVAETKDEAKADLAAKANELKAAITKFGGSLGAAAKDAEWPARAAGHLTAADGTLRDVAGKLAGKITPEIIAQVRAARVQIEQTVDALADEPPGRARSQIANDPEHKKIVMFGGDGLDRTLSDTWVYDCATRTWEQKFPKTCPSPRAGHVLAWLPKAKRIVLAGGYSREPLAQDVWAYDVATNEWKPLLSVPLGGADGEGRRSSPNAPRVDARGTQVGAVTEDDTLVCAQSANPGLITWACKVDPARPDASAGKAPLGTPGQYSFNRIDPADWEKVANPDPERMKKFFADMPANQWTSIKFAKYAPGAHNRWGTTAYDPDRHQLLFWGGGHATSHENDVAHFSVLGGCWTIGYHPDDPIETVYAEQPTPLSFRDRAHVPIHAYRAYAYDPPSGKMLFFDRAYNVAAREWEPAPVPGLKHKGVMHTFAITTPAGAVAYSGEGLFRFDAKTNAWAKLPWQGPNPNDIWCDGNGLCYDSKRNCLWLANNKDIYKYDITSGQSEKIAMTKPKAMGEFMFYSEEAYLPDADVILIMKLFKAPDGKLRNMVWDPNDGKFYWADLKFVADGKEVALKDSPFSWQDAIHYDPALKLVVLNDSTAGRVWALKFDRKSAKLEEVKE